MTMYRSRALTIDAVQFDGENLDELRKLTAPALATLERAYRENVVILLAPERHPRLLHVGDWLSYSNGAVVVHSAVSFAKFWEPVE